MKKRILLTAATTIGVVAAIIGTTASALAPLTNGSFETGTDPGSYATLSAGDSTTINGWTVSTGSVDYIGNYWQAADGARSIDLSGNTAGAIQTTIPTVAGHDYTVTFDLAGNPDGGPAVKTLKVTTNAGASSAKTYTFDTTGKSISAMGWTGKTYTFTAPSSNTTVTFASQDNTAYGPALDNVAVTLNQPLHNSQCNNGGWQEYTTPTFASAYECRAWVHASANGNLTLINPSQQVKFDVNNKHFGSVTYQNFDYPGGLKYKTDALATNVNPSTKDARFAFQIPAGHPGLSGLYVVVYVKHVANGPDLYGHEVAPDLATATQWVQTGTGFSPTMYTVTSGKVHIN
jgi:choice-of-anchor C domain-containing protein